MNHVLNPHWNAGESHHARNLSWEAINLATPSPLWVCTLSDRKFTLAPYREGRGRRIALLRYPF